MLGLDFYTDAAGSLYAAGIGAGESTIVPTDPVGLSANRGRTVNGGMPSSVCTAIRT